LIAGFDLGVRRLSVALIAMDPDNDAETEIIIQSGVILDDDDEATRLQSLGTLTRILLCTNEDIVMACIERPAGNGSQTMSAAFGAVCSAIPTRIQTRSLYPQSIRKTLSLPQSGRLLTFEGAPARARTRAHKHHLMIEAAEWLAERGYNAPITHDDADAVHCARAARIREWADTESIEAA